MLKKRRVFAAFFILLLLALSPVQTIMALSNTTLKNGMSGEAVSKLQQDLKTLGYFKLNPTGYFGDITEAAVIKFQKNYNLEPDGKVGSSTYSKLNSLLKKTNTVKIVVDPGHGGIDPGTLLGRDSESHITLSISKKLQAYLADASCNVVMTRTSDISLSSRSTVEGTLERKDLNARTNIINGSGAKLFVSIHVNSNPDSPELSGSIVYYNAKLPQSRTLALSIQKELNSISVNNRKRRANSIEQANYYVLRNSNIPGVLVETAYVTNAQERQLLMSEDFQAKLAKAVANGIKASGLAAH